MLGPCWLLLCFKAGRGHVSRLRAFEACWGHTSHFHALKQARAMLNGYVPLRHVGPTKLGKSTDLNLGHTSLFGLTGLSGSLDLNLGFINLNLGLQAYLVQQD